MKTRSIVVLICLSLFFTCSNKNEKDSVEIQSKSEENRNVRIGFSQMNHINPWRVAETNDIRRMAKERGYELIIRDGESSQEKQIQDVRELLKLDIDYLLLAPIEFEGFDAVFSMCRKAGVPVILIDRDARGTAGKDFLTYIGGDFVREARILGELLAEKTGGKARIIELKGREGASCVTDRYNGFHDVVDQYPDMEIIVSEYADFERIKGQKTMEEILLSQTGNFNAIYAHNDEMAIGAIQALKSVGIKPGDDYFIISIDGSKDALKAILAGELDATVECTPRFADKIAQVIELHKGGEEVPPRVYNPLRLFTIENALEHFNNAF